MAARDLPALLLALASEDVTAALGCDLNIVAASVRVSNLLLLAGRTPAAAHGAPPPAPACWGRTAAWATRRWWRCCWSGAPVWTQVGPLTTGQCRVGSVTSAVCAGDTPLVAAAGAGHGDTVAALLRCGAGRDQDQVSIYCTVLYCGSSNVE